MTNLFLFKDFVSFKIELEAFLLDFAQVWKVKGNHNELLVDLLGILPCVSAALLEVEGFLIFWDLEDVVLAVYATSLVLGLLNVHRLANNKPLNHRNPPIIIFIRLLEYFLHVFNNNFFLFQISL